MSGSLPIEPDEAAALLEPLAQADRVVLAVSGGPDSVALMNLAARAARQNHPQLVVATVDHGLQARSAATAAGVLDQARRLGLEAHVLSWDGPKPSTGIQEAAREARYHLLAGLAETLGARLLVTAHTLDDQAETILLRMARGSGPAGLIGMRDAVIHYGILHVRPFLAIEKARLEASCRRYGWRFVEDPANSEHRFARSRIRALMPCLAAEGLDAKTLATLAARLATDQEAIDAMAESLRGLALASSGPDRQTYNAGPLFGAPRAVLLRTLGRALSDFSHPGSPRLGRLERLAGELDQAFRRGERCRRSLHGALVLLSRSSCLEVTREKPRRRGTLSSEARGQSPRG